METSKEERPVVAKRLRNRDISIMETSKEERPAVVAISKEDGTVSQNLNYKKNREIEVYSCIFFTSFL